MFYHLFGGVRVECLVHLTGEGRGLLWLAWVVVVLNMKWVWIVISWGGMEGLNGV